MDAMKVMIMGMVDGADKDMPHTCGGRTTVTFGYVGQLDVVSTFTYRSMPPMSSFAVTW